MRLKPIAVLAGCLACGKESDDTLQQARDVRIAAPAPEADKLDLLTQEFTIAPGDDKMYCEFIDYSDDDVAIRAFDSRQGEGGHHLLLLTTSNRRPNGTVEDCSDRAAMADMRPLILPLDLPEGHAVRLTKGMQFVFQLHYVNTFTEPLLIRDVARLEKTPIDQVTHWVAPFATNDALFEVNPKAEGEKTFDCTVDAEGLELILLGGHMHENGTLFDVQIGPTTEQLTSLYYVDPWRAEFRDTPPITTLFDSPVPLPKGTVVRTSCKWKNATDKKLEFPHEMCSTFGYLRGAQSPWICDTGGLGSR
ncbi:MAG: hypothetical protein HY791_26645 [Deltaproteobacteria bacterium]|nr:hypothetical protein [Deltaproteobacteria bacterium]